MTENRAEQLHTQKYPSRGLGKSRCLLPWITAFGLYWAMLPAALSAVTELGSRASGVSRVSDVQERGDRMETPQLRMTVRVLVLNFDPWVLDPATKELKRLHSYAHWNDPRELARGYIADIRKASGGRVKHEIVDWDDVDHFPVKADGFRYKLTEYLECHARNQGWHQPDGVDYEKTVVEHNVLPRLEQNEIDEVWFFGPPYSGFWESAMAGPRAFEINGGAYPKVPSLRPFAIMGYNYERGAAEMLHDLSHRTEATMTRIFGGWKADVLDHDWSKFAAAASISGGKAGCGNCHFPPNGEKDYDYANPRKVDSTAENWLTYPHLSGVTTPITAATWGGPDHHRNYLVWWFSHLPHQPGTHPEHRRELDWWKYIYKFDMYDESGRPR